MKKLISMILGSFFLIVVLIYFAPIKANIGRVRALEKRGDYCWNFSNPVLEISGTFQLHFTNIGNDHYLCSGIMYVDGYEMQLPAYGNAEIIGGEIYLTLSLAGVRNGVIGIDMQKAILDIATLDGTFEYIGVYYDAVEISSGTLTYTMNK